MSHKYAQDIVWAEDVGSSETAMDIDDDESDRLFTFEVAKTNEQEENVTCQPGFNVMRYFIIVSHH